MTLDTLIAECERLHYRPDIKLTERGWDVTLWSGPIGYTSYTTFISPSIAEALHSAMVLMLSGQAKTLQSPDPIAAGHDLSAIMQTLKAAIPAQPPISRVRKWDE